MPRRSKLDKHAAKILKMREEGATYREISAEVNSSAANVYKWVKSRLQDKHRKQEAELAETQKTYQLRVEDLDSKLAKIIEDVMKLDAMEQDVRRAVQSKIEAVREGLKRLGAYAPDTAVQVNVATMQIRERVKGLLDDHYGHG